MNDSMEAGPSFVPLLKNDTLTEDLTIETSHVVTGPTALDFDIYSFTTISSICLTFCATIVLFAHTYLLLASRYLRKPISVNLQLCISLTLADLFCAVCYILTYTVNVFFFGAVSNCVSLLIEVVKLAMFASSVFTLLFLAVNHYVGIVYPLRRHLITTRTVKVAIAIAYLFPLTAYFLLFIIVDGGLRAPIAFDFISKDGCQNGNIHRNEVFRILLVAPFIIFVLLLVLLYGHILFHMKKVTTDPLLQNCNNKRTGKKLNVTLVLLVGSACVGWLPTTLNFVLPMVVELNLTWKIILGVGTQVLHVLKLLADAFIYARRLVEVRCAMWMLDSAILSRVNCLLGRRDYVRSTPQEFTKYLSETRENKSARSKRARSELEAESRFNPKLRHGSEKLPKRRSQVSSVEVEYNSNHIQSYGRSHSRTQSGPVSPEQTLCCSFACSATASSKAKTSHRFSLVSKI
ncbi:hypothetical protein WR25_01990 [Diploscapter pachys]|uniref:G-protein coupled receptors family 1 profile domain-containing protein n=1 Tax=Diploscapter pachys TaxID=2018661 RepID=A0A2A2L458_9BILA|nr:hypothetical protein WR25_01990 [Diploscapter pachys]